MNSQPNQTAQQRTKTQRFLRFLIWSVGAVVALLTIAGTHQWLTWPNVNRLVGENPQSTAFIDAFRERRGDSVLLRWEWVDWDGISPNVKGAVLVAEDIEFFTHSGFSVAEMRVAIRAALETGDAPRGASTLTQQVAKNLWLSPSRNPLRKLKEAVLTMQLENTLDKERVFELYLNIAEFGPGIYGVEAASNEYFSKSAQDLTRREGTLLAASLSRPSRWNPRSSSPGYLARANRIDDLMLQHRNYLERMVGLQPARLAASPDETFPN